MKRKKTETAGKNRQRKRFLLAKRKYEKLFEEIAPFLKRRVHKEFSTVGKWRETSSLCQ